jgi:hypothetical protein
MLIPNSSAKALPRTALAGGARLATTRADVRIATLAALDEAGGIVLDLAVEGLTTGPCRHI